MKKRGHFALVFLLVRQMCAFGSAQKSEDDEKVKKKH